jgi:hypothetical protein
MIKQIILQLSSVVSALVLLPFLSVALHESGTRKALLGPWLNDTDVYLNPLIKRRNYRVTWKRRGYKYDKANYPPIVWFQVQIKGSNKHQYTCIQNIIYACCMFVIQTHFRYYDIAPETFVWLFTI